MKKTQVAIQPNPFLDSKQAMAFLSISRMTLNRLKEKGTLTTYKLGGKLYFSRDQMISAIKAGKEEAIEVEKV